MIEESQIKVNIIRLGAANKSINLGTIEAQTIDLALKMQSLVTLSPMHCLTSSKIMVEL